MTGSGRTLSPGGVGPALLALAASPDGGIVFSRDALSDRNLRRATLGYATVDGVLAADALDGAGLSDAVLRLLPRPDGSVVMVGLFNSIAGRPWRTLAIAASSPAASFCFARAVTSAAQPSGDSGAA